MTCEIRPRYQYRHRRTQSSQGSVGTPGQLFYGAFRSARREENLAKVRNLYESFVILPLNNTVVEHYGSTRVALEARGGRLPILTC